MSAINPELHPYFSPDVLDQVALLRLSHVRQPSYQEQQDLLADLLLAPGQPDQAQTLAALDRLAKVLLQVRDDQRTTAALLMRVLDILAESAAGVSP